MFPQLILAASVYNLTPYQNRVKQLCVWVSPTSCPLSHWSATQPWMLLRVERKEANKLTENYPQRQTPKARSRTPRRKTANDAWSMSPTSTRVPPGTVRSMPWTDFGWGACPDCSLCYSAPTKMLHLIIHSLILVPNMGIDRKTKQKKHGAHVKDKF